MVVICFVERSRRRSMAAAVVRGVLAITFAAFTTVAAVMTPT